MLHPTLSDPVEPGGMMIPGNCGVLRGEGEHMMAESDNAWLFRRLLRATRMGSLATSDAAGQAYVSLVTPAFLPDLSPVVLLSTLSEHTRQLQAEPRCGLMVVGSAPETNPQTAPRISLVCTAVVDTSADARARYLAVHPYAALYADFTDFSFWRLSIVRASFVGGFARAGRLSAAALQPDPAAVASILAAEPSVLAHCNADHADALALLAGGGDGWRMVTADTDGCDLAREDVVRRIAWPAPVGDAGALRAALVQLVGEARAARRAGE
jgi:putative heme iron utilization protein